MPGLLARLAEMAGGGSAGGAARPLWFILCRQLCERMVGERAIQLWLVRAVLRALSFLAKMGGPAGDRKWKAEFETAEFRRWRSAIRVRVPRSAPFLPFSSRLSPLVLLFPFRLFEIGNPDWRPLGWLHAIIVVALTLLIIWRAGGGPWLRHFAFPVCFFLSPSPG